ncbi:hypothetical protein [Martelella endophytica]|uniref:hypothetical protein n=1 Tax=Martelella endophytica TaxID=1486262 RepID=UPI000ACDD717|nr:hypothetical protein [Martelella endophytica]
MPRSDARLISTAALFAALICASAQSATANDRADRDFFNDVAGKWSGPGEIVEGKMKGTRFRCELDGLPLEDGGTGFRLDGRCRTGMFSHPVTAVFIREGDTYRGQFLDGSEGEGLDVTDGVIEDGKAVIQLKRDKVTGALVANLLDAENFNITLLIKGGTRFVPVIGLSLKRETDALAVGAIK